MPLPPIAFYSIYELSARWGCHPADVAGWAAAGHFQVLAGIPPVSCGDDTVAGLVEVPIAELMPMFRRYGPSDELCRLKRVLPPGSKVWLKVTDPLDGLPIRSSDLLLAAFSVQRFEEERDLLRRPAANTGSTPRYEWDAMYAWLFWFAHEKGLPNIGFGVLGRRQAAEVNWDHYTNEKLGSPFWEKIKVAPEVEALIKTPPKRQIIDLDGNLGWEQTGAVSSIQDLIGAVRRVRNNLFHGGKSGDPDADRNTLLYAAALFVVDRILREDDVLQTSFSGTY